MTDTLKHKILSGVLWQGLERIGSQGISFLISIVLARLLTPSEFGVLAIMMVFVAICGVFIDSGFSTALIQKKDVDSKELIDGEAFFKILNTDINEYFTIDGQEIFKTKEGILSIDNIPYGNYELIEVEAPEGYQILEEKISFVILGEEKIELEVFNKLQNGVLQIEKLDYDSLKPLQGVLFGLYDQDKQLIGEYETDEKGMITISNLLEGIYYIKELNAPSNYELLDGFMEANIQNNVLSNFKITNRLKIEVPKTGVNEFLYTILFSSVCLFIGMVLCNYDQNN